MLPEGNSICQHTHTGRGRARGRGRSCGRERTRIELDVVGDLGGLQVDADRVVDLDEGVRVADGAGVVGDQVGDAFGANDDLPHLAQLVLHAGEDKSSDKPTQNEPTFQEGTRFLG